MRDTTTKFLLSDRLPIIVVAATIWYEKMGPGALLILPTDDFMNFMDPREKSKAKCQLDPKGADGSPPWAVRLR